MGAHDAEMGQLASRDTTGTVGLVLVSKPKGHKN
jgi:hypothetical protein